MVLDWRLRLALIVGGVVLVCVTLAGAAWGDLDLETAMQSLTALGALLAGVGIAGGKGGAAAALVIVAVSGLGGCGAACQTERTVVDALGAGITAADGVVGEQGGEEYDLARTITLGAHQLGEAAVDACELLRDGVGWQAWVSLALEATMSLAATIDGAGPADIAGPVPLELTTAIELLEIEARQ